MRVKGYRQAAIAALVLIGVLLPFSNTRAAGTTSYAEQNWFVIYCSVICYPLPYEVFGRTGTTHSTVETFGPVLNISHHWQYVAVRGARNPPSPCGLSGGVDTTIYSYWTPIGANYITTYYPAYQLSGWLDPDDLYFGGEKWTNNTVIQPMTRMSGAISAYNGCTNWVNLDWDKNLP